MTFIRTALSNTGGFLIYRFSRKNRKKHKIFRAVYMEICHDRLTGQRRSLVIAHRETEMA